jgi:hypothetical protein
VGGSHEKGKGVGDDEISLWIGTLHRWRETGKFGRFGIIIIFMFGEKVEKRVYNNRQEN